MKLYTLDQVIGHTNTKSWLTSKLQQDKIPKVMLFSGNPGLGKTSIAKIIACELACKDVPEKIDATKKKVIDECISTDCVRLYNMSNLKSQEAVLEVKNDLSVGLSSTGRKVIIMDEAHGMSEEAQDSLLVRFENLEDNVYIIICTTEVASFRDAFLSRCISVRFNQLSNAEVKKLIHDELESAHIEFAVSANMALAYIMSACHMEPRRISNLIASLDNSKPVTKDDLLSFNAMEDDKVYGTLIKYLYSNNIVNGLQFINDMPTGFSDGGISMLLEMTKVALGGQSYMIANDTANMLKEIVGTSSPDKLLKFVSTVSTAKYPTKNYVSGVFIKLCCDINKPPERVEDTTIQNLNIMRDTIERDEVIVNERPMAPSLESLMENGTVLTEDSLTD